MNQDFLSLKPEPIWRFFYEITQIPHTSHNLDGIRKYLIDFSNVHGLQCDLDAAGNVLICKNATVTMERGKKVILQAHMDMVGQKNADSDHNFEIDPLKPYIDGDWVKADGTTLGADNGIGMAAILAVLSSDDIPHPQIEALFTSDEETGMFGAIGLKNDLLNGSIMINTDSEEDGSLFIGCAGGSDLCAYFKYQKALCDKNGKKAFKLIIGGLKGGHSGLDINLGRGNAIKLLFRFLNFATKGYEAYISYADGGNVHNSIPRSAEAIVVIGQEYEKSFKEEVKIFEELFRREYRGIEDGIVFTAEDTEMPDGVVPEVLLHRFVNSIVATPDGVERMISNDRETVETSSCLTMLHCQDGEIHIHNLVRSSTASRKYSRVSMLMCLYNLAGADTKLEGDYSGWEPNNNSPILKLTKVCYKNIFGKEPCVKIMHAGLECGIISAQYPKLDIISIGPNIMYPHSPNEKVEISSVNRFWDLIVGIIGNIPKTHSA